MMSIKSIFLSLLPFSSASFTSPPPLIASLPSHLVPTHANNRRLIIIGDIHGMHTSLNTLLSSLDFSPEKDHIIAAGDMVNKGKHSPEVVDILMGYNASAVRGNHEDNVLHTRNKAARRTMKQLSRKQLRWLAGLPIILNIDELAMFVVHAGMVPGVKPEKQDPWAVMNMRTLVYPTQELRRRHSEGGSAVASDADLEDDEVDVMDVPVPTDGREGTKWNTAWNKRQNRQKKLTRRTIVYGHDAKRGLVLGEYTFGLDSGCVRGGELTAMVVKGTKDGDWKYKIHQIPCKEEK